MAKTNSYPDLTSPSASLAGENFSYPNLSKALDSKPEKSQTSADKLTQGLLTPMSVKDRNDAAGLATMMLAPEVKLGSMLPAVAKSLLPKLSGAGKISHEILSSLMKQTGASYAGSKMMGASNEQAEDAAIIGGGATAAMTPAMMMLKSMSPYARMLAGSAMGALSGNAASALTGHEYGMTAGGGLAGALMGLRGRGASELAASNLAKQLVPEHLENANARIPAANAEGLPLNAYEATGSVGVKSMLNEAAANEEGAKVLYPWALNRQKAEGQVHENLLNKISPEMKGNSDVPFSVGDSKTGMRNAMYDLAADMGDKRGTKISVAPVLKHIESVLPYTEGGSKIATALKTSIDRLDATPNTISVNKKLLQPFDDGLEHLSRQSNKLKSEIAEMKANQPPTYFKQSVGYDKKLKYLQKQLNETVSAMGGLSELRNRYAVKNKISKYENTIGGLHYAKQGIQGVLEGQGSSAIGGTAAGKLKNVQSTLDAQLKSASPEYEAASHIANMDRVRGNVVKSMDKANNLGGNFYDRVLKSNADYTELYDSLKNPYNPKVPSEAQKSLSNLKTAMPDLMDNLAENAGSTIGRKDNKFHLPEIAASLTKNLFMNRYNKAVAELLINPQWREELAKIAKMSKGEDRGVALGRLFGKIGAAGSSVNSQGSENGSID